MEEPRTLVHLQTDRLNVGEIVDSVISPACGAVSTFIGTTRDNFQSKTVVKLEYEAYEPMALREMAKICERIREKWQIRHIAIHHRLGEVPVCEASVAIAISSPHRQDSLQAVQFAIDQLKSSVPIWKKEIYSDERGEWKENAECSWSSSRNVAIKIEPPEPAEDDFEGSEDRTTEVSPAEVKVEVDPSHVQIRASPEELRRRIDAFIARKREQVNVFNIQEFCSHRNLREDTESSCARVDAILIPRKDSKSHVKVHRVFNTHGPQTMTSWAHQASPMSPEGAGSLNPAVDERLSGAEKFLGIDKPVPRDIYQRIKNIEDRILYLESLSPEYRDFFVSPTSGGQERSTRPVRKRTYSTAELDNKLVELEEKYYKRVR